MKPDELQLNHIYCGDTLEVLKTFPSDCVDTIITSPPYWGLRDYGVDGQIGLEPTLDEFLNKLLGISEQLKRVLKPTGVMFWNHGDSYASHGKVGGDIDMDKGMDINRGRSRIRPGQYQPKCLMLQNYRLILRMIDEQNWILRNTIVWHKPNHMPSSVKDRFANSYEPVFMLVKKKKYWFDLNAVRVKYKPSTFERKKYAHNQKKGQESGGVILPAYEWRPPNEWVNPTGKNPGDLWKIPTQPFPEAHFATFPEKLVMPMIKSSCPKEICKKCAMPRERITKGRSGSAFNIRVRDAKAGRLNKKSGFGRTNKGQMSAAETYYKEKEYGGQGKQTVGWTDCGCNAGWRSGVVLDPFMGAGTTAVVARRLGRGYIGIELNKEYIKIAKKRLSQQHLGI